MKTVYTTDPTNRTVLEEIVTAEMDTEPSVAFAYLYGSFAEGDTFHDIDVGVYLKGVDEPVLSAKALDLAQRLSTQLKMPVDVRALNTAPVSFLYHVLRGKLILSRDETLRTDLMEDTVRRYLDIAPLLRHATKEAFAA